MFYKMLVNKIALKIKISIFKSIFKSQNEECLMRLNFDVSRVYLLIFQVKKFPNVP